MSKGKVHLLTKNNSRYTKKHKSRYIKIHKPRYAFLRAYLARSLKPVAQNYLFSAYLFILLSQYCVQEYLVCKRPKWVTSSRCLIKLESIFPIRIER